MIRVSELDGALLALWVARIGCVDAVLSDDAMRCLTFYSRDHDGKVCGRSYSPHEHWSDGGPLIEKHHISVEYGYGDPQPWYAEIGFERNLTDGVEMYGVTPLVAAMRALVASVYGDTVDEEVAP